jgi:hypothetical protein
LKLQLHARYNLPWKCNSKEEGEEEVLVEETNKSPSKKKKKKKIGDHRT